MPEIIISDTSCLILLSKINELDLLKACYGKVTIPSEIALEFGQGLPEWIEIREVKDRPFQKTKLAQTDFRVSDKILKQILKIVGEN